MSPRSIAPMGKSIEEKRREGFERRASTHHFAIRINTNSADKEEAKAAELAAAGKQKAADRHLKSATKHRETAAKAQAKLDALRAEYGYED